MGLFDIPFESGRFYFKVMHKTCITCLKVNGSEIVCQLDDILIVANFFLPQFELLSFKPKNTDGTKGPSPISCNIIGKPDLKI